MKKQRQSIPSIYHCHQNRHIQNVFISFVIVSIAALYVSSAFTLSQMNNENKCHRNRNTLGIRTSTNLQQLLSTSTLQPLDSYHIISRQRHDRIIRYSTNENKYESYKVRFLNHLPKDHYKFHDSHHPSSKTSNRFKNSHVNNGNHNSFKSDNEEKYIPESKGDPIEEDFASKINLDEKKLRQLRLLQNQQQTPSLMFSGQPDDSSPFLKSFTSSGTTTNGKSNGKISSPTSADDGLSRFHRRLPSNRQRLVTGTYPLYVSVRDSPTRKWLGSSRRCRTTALFPPLDDGTGEALWEQKQQLMRQQLQGIATSQLYVNGTIAERSLASFERYDWLDDDTKDNKNDYYVSTDDKTCLSMELIAEIYMRKPAYLNLLPKHLKELKKSTEDDKEENNGDGNNGLTSWFLKLQQQRQKEENPLDDLFLENNEMLWVTDFSLTKKGGVTSIDTRSGAMRPLGKTSGILGGIGKAISNADKTNNQVGISFGWPNEVGPVPLQKFSPSLLSSSSSSSSQHKGEREKELHSDSTKSSQSAIESYQWNNHKPVENYENALLVTDGFLVPGRENGGLYVVKNLGQDNLEWKVCLTGGNVSPEAEDTEWFYHRAVWVDLTGDGRKSILTARAKRPSILNTNSNTDTSTTTSSSSSSRIQDIDAIQGDKGQLIWLECPKPYRYDEETGTPLDEDDTVFDPFSAKHLPWKLRVLEEGPDVMFSIADLDTTDNTIEVFAAQFFGKRVSLHSIQVGNEGNNFLPNIVFRRVLDDKCGASFSSILANLEEDPFNGEGSQKVVVDSGSTIETLKPGDTFSHLLVTSHECSFASPDGSENEEEYKTTRLNTESDTKENSSSQVTSQMTSLPETSGGSLFAYRVPTNWKTDPWKRTVIATGFRVRGQLGNMINPGAPGFCYTFYPRINDSKQHQSFSRPHIAVSGDCAEAAYIFSPVEYDEDSNDSMHCVRLNGCNVGAPSINGIRRQYDSSTKYSLMCEIECGATVGSLAIGYDNFCGAKGQREGYAKMYIPCFEKDKVLVFAFGNGEKEELDIDIKGL